MIRIHPNQGPAERIARGVLGLILLFPGWRTWRTAGASIALWGLGALAVLTGATGWCPLYAALGRNHRPGE